MTKKGENELHDVAEWDSFYVVTGSTAGALIRQHMRSILEWAQHLARAPLHRRSAVPLPVPGRS
jgi:hypothetical protein